RVLVDQAVDAVLDAESPAACRRELLRIAEAAMLEVLVKSCADLVQRPNLDDLARLESEFFTVDTTCSRDSWEVRSSPKPVRDAPDVHAHENAQEPEYPD